jgi:hypothetical protein
MRWSTVKDLTHRAETGIEQVILDRFQTHLCGYRITMDAILSQGIMAKQPGPDRALMVGAVPLLHATQVMRPIIWMRGGERAQSIGTQELSPTLLDHLGLSGTV